MKITLDNQGEGEYRLVCTIETGRWDEDIWEAGELIKQALLGIGYQLKTVQSLFNEEEDDEAKDTENDNNIREKVEDCSG
jgi:hypothetical protein